MREFERLRRSLRPAARPVGEADHEAVEPAAPEAWSSHVTVQPLPVQSVAQSAVPSGGVTVVAAGAVWSGTLTAAGSLRVHGRVTGEIVAAEAVYIAEGAEVDATVRAAIVVVAGHLTGGLEARERLEVQPTGRVRADLVTRALVVHDGAVVEGQLRMQRPEGDAGGQEPDRPGDAMASLADAAEVA